MHNGNKLRQTLNSTDFIYGIEINELVISNLVANNPFWLLATLVTLVTLLSSTERKKRTLYAEITFYVCLIISLKGTIKGGF